MTVAELIHKLQALNTPDATILSGYGDRTFCYPTDVRVGTFVVAEADGSTPLAESLPTAPGSLSVSP